MMLYGVTLSYQDAGNRGYNVSLSPAALIEFLPYLAPWAPSIHAGKFALAQSWDLATLKIRPLGKHEVMAPTRLPAEDANGDPIVPAADRPAFVPYAGVAARVAVPAGFWLTGTVRGVDNVSKTITLYPDPPSVPIARTVPGYDRKANRLVIGMDQIVDTAAAVTFGVPQHDR